MIHLRAAVLYTLLLAYLISSSWLRWPDPWMDFGYFLYNSSAVARGLLIGRDFNYHYGPLALYFFAGCFKLFGPSILLVFAANFLLLLLDLALVYGLFSVFSPACALLGGAAFLSAFALGQFIPQGNYNFLAPYKPEATVGTTLVLLLLWCSYRWREGLRPARLFLLGLLLGALLLTSTEVLLAGALALAVLFLAQPWPGLKAGLAFLAGAAALPLLSFGYFLARADAGLAAAVTFKALSAVKLAGSPVFLELSGLDRPLFHLVEIAEAMGCAAFVSAAYFLAYDKFPLLRERRLFYWGGVLLLPLMMVAAREQELFWLEFGRSLPVVPLLGLLLWFRARRKELLLGMWSAFSLAMLSRMALNPVLHHYGFFLCLGAGLAVAPIFLSRLPEECRGQGQEGEGFRAFGYSLLITLVLSACLIRAPYFARKSFALSEGKNPVFDWSDGTRGPAGAELLAYLRSQLRPGDKLLGIPDGHMVNFLLGVDPPLPLRLTSGELIQYGAEALVEGFHKDAPRFVFLFVNEKFGGAGLGPNNGQAIFAWLDREYRVARTFGQPTKIYLLERKGREGP